MIGDMNAQIGRREIYWPAVGNQGFRQGTNDKGRRRVYFAAFRNMLIGSTIFEHKNIKKVEITRWTLL
jgi:hypothetical protein